MFGETTILYVKIWNQPTETIIKKGCLGYQVVNMGSHQLVAVSHISFGLEKTFQKNDLCDMFDDGQFYEIPPFLKNKSHLELSNFELRPRFTRWSFTVWKFHLQTFPPPKQKQTTKRKRNSAFGEKNTSKISGLSQVVYLPPKKGAPTSYKWSYFTPMAKKYVGNWSETTLLIGGTTPDITGVWAHRVGSFVFSFAGFWK